MFIVWIKQVWKLLTVLDIGGCDRISTGESRVNIDDLATAGEESLEAEVGVKHHEERYNHCRLARSLPEEGDHSGVCNAVHHAKPDQLLKGAPVIHLEFKALPGRG